MGTASRGRKNSPGTNVRGSGSTWTSVFTWNQESGSRLSKTADITGEEGEGHKDGQHPRDRGSEDDDSPDGAIRETHDASEDGAPPVCR